MSVLEGEWSRKELIECKIEEWNNCKQSDRCEEMDEINRWTDGTETDVSRWTDRTDRQMEQVEQVDRWEQVDRRARWTDGTGGHKGQMDRWNRWTDGNR